MRSETRLNAYSASLQSLPAAQSWRRRLGSWPAYAAATGSALALATSAAAGDIVYSGLVHESLSIPEPGTHLQVGDAVRMTRPLFPNFQFRMSNQGQPETSFRARIYAFPSPSAHPGISVLARWAGSAVGALASGFTLGSPITAHSAAVNTAGNTQPHWATDAFLARTHGTARHGNWPLNGTLFAGLKLPDGDLGWIRIQLQDTNSSGYAETLNVIDWAYNTTPGATILAGEVPEPGTRAMLLLALGAAGILALRKCRNAAKQPMAN